MANHNVSATRTLIITCVTASLAGLLFGMDMGTLSGAFPYPCQHFNVIGSLQGWIISIMMPGAMIGSLGCSTLASHFDRKYCLMLSGGIFIIGIGGVSLASTIEYVIIFRFICGIAIGISSCITPAYLSEIAPERLRGRVVSLYQLMITIGILIGYLSDAALSYSHTWRWMIAVSLLPALVMFIGTLYLPASPRWMVLHSHPDEAQKVLMLLGGDRQSAQREIAKISAGLKERQAGWTFFKTDSNFRRAVYLAMLLQLMQQLTGISVVMYYAPRLLMLAGYANASQQMWGSVIIGLCNVGATLVALQLVDRWGRKPVLLTGFSTMALSMWGLGYSLYFGHAQISAIVMLIAFILGFAMSIGPLAWVLCAEIQPLRGRDFGLACSTATNWIANMTIGVLFIIMLENIGVTGTFWIYAGCNALFIALTFALLPETRNIALEKIEENLLAGKPLRKIGR